MIDDKVCCLRGEVIYAKCRNPTEIWVQMIEKAYAKLHNCYQALNSGDVAQGLSDMTGYVADKLDISIYDNMVYIYIGSLGTKRKIMGYSI